MLLAKSARGRQPGPPLGGGAGTSGGPSGPTLKLIYSPNLITLPKKINCNVGLKCSLVTKTNDANLYTGGTPGGGSVIRGVLSVLPAHLVTNNLVTRVKNKIYLRCFKWF